MSSPARGTWIEICWNPIHREGSGVVPRKGDVDRNTIWDEQTVKRLIVVPRKGDVDRNSSGRPAMRAAAPSSPARGTWIEIYRCFFVVCYCCVVPRKGDVDRNMTTATKTSRNGLSSPARGTWIEIGQRLREPRVPCVVPRKGDVDRND